MLAALMSLPGEQLPLHRMPACEAPPHGMCSHRTLHLSLGTTLPRRTGCRIPGDRPFAPSCLKSDNTMPTGLAMTLSRQRVDSYPSAQRDSSLEPVRALRANACSRGPANDTQLCRKATSGRCSSRSMTARSASAAEAAIADEICLPINYFEMLQVTSEASAETVDLMCESKLRSPPTEGYSMVALAARAQVLEAARDTLLDDSLRQSYLSDLRDSRRQDPGLDAVPVDVPLEQAPGILCVLQEAGGRAGTVAEAGLALLARWDERDQPGRRDLALATALAYADLSRDSITANPPAVRQGCELLEAALGVLKDEGGEDFAQELQESIASTLLEMGPTCLLELLALPVGPDNEAARQEGLQGMRELLWRKQEDGKPAPKVGSYTREIFMKESFLRMTTSELVDFFNAAPPDVDAGLLEVYWVALAYLGRAFFYKRPQDVMQGEALLKELEESPSYQALVLATGGREGRRVSAGATLPGTDVPASLATERAMCALLLGRIEEAKKWLGLDTQPPSGDLAVAQFVYLNSPGGSQAWVAELVGGAEESGYPGGAGAENGGLGGAGEGEEVLLPGLCVLLEVWLREVVSMRFRDTCTEPVQLSAYFDSPEVLGFLEKLPDDRSKSQGLGSFLGGEAGAVGTRIVSGAVGALKSALEMLPQVPSQVPLPSLGPFPGTTSPASGGPDPWTRDGQQGGGGWNPLGGVLSSLSTTAPAATAKSRTERDLHLTGEPFSSPAPAPPSYSPYAPPPPPPPAPESPATSVNPYATKPFDPSAKPQGAYPGAAKAVLGPDGVGTLSKLVGALAAMAAAAATVLLVYQASTALRRAPSGTPQVSTEGAPGAEAAAKPSETESWGSAVIRNWQQVKASALGPQHRLEGLREVLDGQMLDLWEERAKEVQANGWHWEYQFIDLQVESAIIAPDKQTAVLVASIQEAARLVDGRDADHNDSYKSTYKARYDLKRSGPGWKITGGTILR